MAQSPLRKQRANRVDFGIFTGLVPYSTVLPSDLDMIIERNGHFLVAEWKNDIENISKGQRILLRALAGQPNFTVLVVRGFSTGKGAYVATFWEVKGDRLIKAGASVGDLKKYVRSWFRTASKRKQSDG